MEVTYTRRTDRWRGWCHCCRVVVDDRGADTKLDYVGPRGVDAEMPALINGHLESPAEHLVIMVNGIIGSARDWQFGAEHFRKRLGPVVNIHCSACNSSRATFDGVDTMGTRLADEIRDIIDNTKGLRKISFVSHSLGGLISRYAISKLYEPPDPASGRPQATIGGLEPANFIAVASPHVGSRGSENLPFLRGIQFLERAAPFMAHWFVGQTGKHLFMTDGEKNLPPLLVRMVTDCEEGPFFSSLKAFRRRTVYANVVYDHAVGWRTSSLRRKYELPEINHQPVDQRYPHIVRDEVCEAQECRMVVEMPNADPVEEEILNGLNRLSWRRVDVSFKGARAAFQAHNTIQVKNARNHSEGEDVINHIIDKHFLPDDDLDSSGPVTQMQSS